jgi:hypothetical protein
MPATPSRSPSYGPNGTHWPGQISGLITPFMYDETVPNQIEVAPTFTAIAAAINALTPAQVSAGVLIRVQPGILVGGGGSSQSALSLNAVGNKTWTKRVTVCPRDGFGTVTISNGMRIDRMRNICLAGFVIDGKLRIQSSTRFAFAWCVVNGNIAVSGTVAGENDPRQWEFVEFVKRQVFQPDATDPMQLQSFDNLGKTLDGLVQDGCYYAPNYMNIGSTAHQDTIQHFSFDNNAFFSGFTYQDTVIFASNRCAVNGGLRNGVFRNCWINARKNNQTPRYPIGPGAEMASAGLSQGTKANITFDGGVYMGSLQSNTGASPNPYPTVLNGAKIDYQPSGQAAPLNGSWVVDTSLNGHTNPGYPPLPTDAFLNNIWGGSYVAPAGKTGQPSLDRFGVYYQTTTVSMLSSTPDAAIYYTTNGSTPTASSTLYTGPITVNATTIFKAIAIGPEPLLPSDVTTNQVTITTDLLSNTSWQHVTLPQMTDDFNIAFNSTPGFANSDALTGIGSTQASAFSDLPIIIRYNTSGFWDARNGSAYAATNPVPYTPGTTYYVRVAVSVLNKTYTVTITPLSGAGANVPVVLAQDFAFRTEQATAASFAYVSMIAPTGSHTIADIELDEGDPVLETAAPPVFSTVQPGKYATPQSVTLATTEPDGEIRYKISPTVTGDVTASDFLYSGPIQLGNAELTIKARTFASGKQPSEHIEGAFSVETVVVPPQQVESVSSDTFPQIFPDGSPPTITASTPRVGASIYYTLDGSTPTSSSTLYTGPIAIPNATTRVKFIAVLAGMLDSEVTTYLYQKGSAGPPSPLPPDNGSDLPTEPNQGPTEILTPQTYLSRARFLTRLTITESGTLAFGGLATDAASREQDVIAGWKLNGTHWQVLDGSAWFTTSTPVQPGIWEVKIEVKQRNYSIYLREEGDLEWITLGQALMLRFRAGIDRTIYQSTLHPITIREIDSKPFRIVLL